MRTTLDIDDDLLIEVRRLADAEQASVGEVLSRLARRGLALQSERSKEPPRRNGVPILPSRDVVITNELIHKLRDEEGI